MAIWQYPITILPLEKVTKHYGEVPEKIEDEFLLSCTNWDILEPVLNFFNERMKPGSTGIFGWGDVDGFDGGPRITEDNKKLESIGFRLDVSKDLSSQFKTVLDLVQLVNGVIIDSNKNFTIPPTLEGLRWAVMRSDSARFVADPFKFLSGLSKK